MSINVMIAGIGGASLGTEIIKSLRLAGGYAIGGCDISNLAYGHYDGLLDYSYLVNTDNYVENVLRICKERDVTILIPGGERPAQIIASAAADFSAAGVSIASNAPELVKVLGDKRTCFERLAREGVRIPRTFDAEINLPSDFPLPCIVKPAVDSGGSSFVFFARTRDEVEIYVNYLANNRLRPVIQEYIDHQGGEFTVGVISRTDGSTAGAIALQRHFPSKLSIQTRGEDFLISSGYSQGYIDKFEHIAAQAISIAESLGSRGPLNIQGRVDKNGTFIPFEINPRFSASTYLRALAGFNEIDFFVKNMLGFDSPPLAIRPGWYLRGLSEVVVPNSSVAQ